MHYSVLEYSYLMSKSYKIVAITQSDLVKKFNGLVLVTPIGRDKKQLYFKHDVLVAFRLMNTDSVFDKVKVLSVIIKAATWTINIPPKGFSVTEEQTNVFHIDIYSNKKWNINGTYSSPNTFTCKPCKLLSNFSNKPEQLQFNSSYNLLLKNFNKFLAEIIVIIEYENAYFAITQSVYCMPFKSFINKTLGSYCDDYAWLLIHILSTSRSSSIKRLPTTTSHIVTAIPAIEYEIEGGEIEEDDAEI